MIYLFAIGGTGAKIAHAYTMLSACGIAPEGNQAVAVSFLDPDRSNGNVGDAIDSALAYEKTRSSVTSVARSPFFRQDIRPSKESWGPLDGVRANTLAQLFAKSTLQTQHPSTAALMDVLFTREEQDQNLADGFRGHPSIGAAVMAERFSLEVENSPIRDILKDVEEAAGNHTKVSVILLGSIFGGTGAAGIPTLAKGLKQELDRQRLANVSIHAVLALPYFGFSFTELQKKEIGLYADAASFLENTRAALDYYYHTNVNDLFDSIYCLGLEEYAIMPVAKEGGAEQKNPACLVELLGATAIHDIVENSGRRGVILSAHRGGKELTPADIPVLNEGGNKLKMDRFTGLALAMTALVLPVVDARKERDAAYPWVHDLLPTSVDSWQSIQSELHPVRTLATWYLKWYGEVCRTTPGFEKVLHSLFRDESKSDLQRLQMLLAGSHHGDAKQGLYRLVEKFSAASMVEPSRGSGVAGMVHALTYAIENVINSGAHQ